MNTLHMFDLDFTLWKTNSKLSIINKNKPEDVVMRINTSDKSLMKTYWKKYNLPMNYNGSTYYLNDILWKELSDNDKNLKLKDLGVSYREWTSKEELTKQITNTEYLLSNLDHLINSRNITLGIITARSDKGNHKNLINELNKKIENKLNIKINRTYFVNDLDNRPNDDITASRKAKIILEHLIGYHIKNNRFINTKQTDYKEVYFYDDYDKNIEAVNNIQKILEICLKKTKPDIKREIIKRLENNELKHNTYMVTNNKVNPFIIKENKLKIPSNFKLFN